MEGGYLKDKLWISFGILVGSEFEGKLSLGKNNVASFFKKVQDCARIMREINVMVVEE